MMELTGFIRQIRHQVGRDGHIEDCACYAYQLDDDDGIAMALGFKTNQLKKPDYFLIGVKDAALYQLIELTDLREDLEGVGKRLKECPVVVTQPDGDRLTAKEIQKRQNPAWLKPQAELCNKWSGGIAIIERLLRKQNQQELDPRYEMWVVCRDGTDVLMLDRLKRKLEGMMRPVNVITTDQVTQMQMLGELKPAVFYSS